jgi:hypothetical protein
MAPAMVSVSVPASRTTATKAATSPTTQVRICMPRRRSAGAKASTSTARTAAPNTISIGDSAP